MRRLEPTAIQLNHVMKVNALLQQVKTQVPSKYGKRKEKKEEEKKGDFGLLPLAQQPVRPRSVICITAVQEYI